MSTTRGQRLYDVGIHSWGSQVTQWVGILFAVCGVIALAIVFGILFGRDDSRYSRMRNDISSLRDAGSPVGFSVYMNGTMNITDATVTILLGWDSSAGVPAYDASNGALNASTGIFTAEFPGQYLATTEACYAGTLGGSRSIAINTDGAAATEMIAEAVAPGDNSTTSQCLNIQTVLELEVGTAVWAEALSDSGNMEMITKALFGLERMTTDL